MECTNLGISMFPRSSARATNRHRLGLHTTPVLKSGMTCPMMKRQIYGQLAVHSIKWRLSILLSRLPALRPSFMKLHRSNRGQSLVYILTNSPVLSINVWIRIRDSDLMSKCYLMTGQSKCMRTSAQGHRLKKLAPSHKANYWRRSISHQADKLKKLYSQRQTMINKF